MKRKAILFFPIGNACGGAERRLIRIFGNMLTDQKEQIVIAVHDKGISTCLRSEIDGWSKGRAVYFNNIISLFCFMIKNKSKWIFAATLGLEPVFVFFFAKLLCIKRCFCSVYHKTSMLQCESKKANNRFELLVSLSNHIDCLYPNAIPLLKKRYPHKKITLTPGAFTDMNKFIPKPKKNKIVFAGTLKEDKGINLFINSIEKIQKILIDNNFLCVVCGDGPLFQSTKEIVTSKKLDDLIQMSGRIVDTSNVLSEAKVFCSLQTPTNYPSQSLIEAMACGCYCIVTNCGESFMMVDESFGVLINATIDSLASAILDAINYSAEKYCAISIASRKYVKEHFSICKSISYFEKIIS